MPTNKLSDVQIFRRLIHIARPYWLQISSIFTLEILAAPLILLMPLPLKLAVDNIIGSAPLPEFLSILIPHSFENNKLALLVLATSLQVIIVLLIHFRGLISYVFQISTGEKLNLIFRGRLFRHVQKLSFAFHDKRGTADSIYRIQYDAPSIQLIIIYGLIPFISSMAILVAMIYVTARINLHLALIALTVIPFLFFLSYVCIQRIRPRYKDVKKMESHALNIVQEVMTAVRVVKAFGREEREQERFMHHSDKTARQRIRLSYSEGLFGLLINLVTAIGAAAVLFIGIRNVQAGILTLGNFLIVTTYITQLYKPLEMMNRNIATLQTSLASAHRAFELLDETPDVIEHAHAQPLKHAQGAVTFDNVSFAYDDTPNILTNISFSIQPGMRVGIAGKTGVGKTTLLSLMTRFYDPSSGEIRLDGVNLQEYKLTDLRNQFAIVLQEPVLFSTSIAENIAYSKSNATENEIISAAKAAKVHDFIKTLPEGYATLVGERGMRLSGGERQRISLARAFLKNAPILLLDEPTSSIDTKTEDNIMQDMESLMQGRTTFMIAHRLTTLKNCDIVLTIGDDQKIVSDLNLSQPTI